MENNEHSNEAEALFATRRRQERQENVERKRLEELERQKQQMAAEVRRLEAQQAAQRAQLAQEARWAQETQQAQQQGLYPGMKPAGAKPALKLDVKKIILYSFAALGVVFVLLLLIEALS